MYTQINTGEARKVKHTADLQREVIFSWNTGENVAYILVILCYLLRQALPISTRKLFVYRRLFPPKTL